MTVRFGQCLSCGHTVSALTSLGVWQGIIAHVQYAHPAPSHVPQQIAEVPRAD